MQKTPGKCRLQGEQWIMEQSPVPPQLNRDINREVISTSQNVKEKCIGECEILYSVPFYQPTVNIFSLQVNYRLPLSIDSGKFNRTSPGDISVTAVPYYNPINESDKVLLKYQSDIPYFKIYDYNKLIRLIGPNITDNDIQALEAINAEFSSSQISLGLILSDDSLLYEKIRRAWGNGKPNDFIVVVQTTTNNEIANVNVVGWGNDELKETVSAAVMTLPSTNIPSILKQIEKSLSTRPKFVKANFSHYSYLDMHLPNNYFYALILFQVIFFSYVIFSFFLIDKMNNEKDNKSEKLDMFKAIQGHIIFSIVILCMIRHFIFKFFGAE